MRLRLLNYRPSVKSNKFTFTMKMNLPNKPTELDESRPDRLASSMLIIGIMLVQGEAALVYKPWWEFDTAAPTDGKFIVEAFDLAGNCTRHEA